MLTIKLASGGGGQGLPERKKATTRGDSRGSAAFRRHQRIPNDAPERLIELEGLWSGVVGLRVSPAISGRGRRPEACPTGLQLLYAVMVVVWCGVRLRSGGRGSIYSRRGKGVRGTAGALWKTASDDEGRQRGGKGLSDHVGSCPDSQTCLCSLRHLWHLRAPRIGQG